MSLQVFLQARLTGIERFLVESSGDLVLRTRWVSLLAEILPRALLAELGLAQLLLGTSGGGQFLVVLPSESVTPADEFLTRAARAIGEVSSATSGSSGPAPRISGTGAISASGCTNRWPWRWPRRLPLSPMSSLPIPHRRIPNGSCSTGAFSRELQRAGWSPETPARIDFETGKRTGPAPAPDGISFARHVALADNGTTPAPLTKLASRAKGRRAWGVLRGDVDSYEVRLNRAQTVEEHIQLSVMYKQFFANELEMLSSMPEFFRKITLLYAGGDDFALFGSWDALIPFARELQRLFHRFVEANVRELAGAEGKTLSMGLAIARETVIR